MSIIPRGIGAPGYTIQRPTDGRYLMTRDELEGRLAVLLGGRAAEGPVFGHLPTGAADDLARASDIARSMVTRYGMVPEIGHMTYETRVAGVLGVPGAAARERDHNEETASRGVRKRTWAISAVGVLAGLGLLDLGARWLVDGAVAIARAVGVSDLIIGLTIVAAGTSLPEVATSIVATIRGERDIAIGNVIGSKIFNVLGILGVSGLLATDALRAHPAVVDFDIPVMIAVAVACLPLFFTGLDLKRWKGALFLGYYTAYVAYLLMAASTHDALPLYSRVMMAYVIPITALTIVVIAGHEWRLHRKRAAV